MGGGWLVADQTGVTVSNLPPNQPPVVNRGSPPLTWPVMDKTKYPDQRKRYDQDFGNAFPKLGDEYRDYNCIGHTLGKDTEWVNPVTSPTGDPLSEMDKIYDEGGYKRVPNMDTSYEPGKEKVVIYATKNPDDNIKEITHGAIQDNN